MAIVVTAVVVSTMTFVVPAGAAGPIVARGVALAGSASCGYGDIDITYDANGVDAQRVQFTAADGSTLHAFEDLAYDPNFHGTEHILSETKTPPPPGTVVAVNVLVGHLPPTAATTAHFFLLYRCDARSNDEGGTNAVLQTCVGDYGACPQTAKEALAAGPTSPPAATPVVARPTYSG